MWEVKTFKSRAAMNRWIEKNGSRYQYVEVYINNGWALDVRRLRIIG
jgi:hypothetical protein